MEHVSRARALFLAGYNCSQAVFAAFSDVTGVEEKAALRLSSALGGGVSRLREVCGAVSGMALVLGAVSGYDTPDGQKKNELYALTQSLAKEFMKEHKTVVCRELLGLPQGPDSPVSPVRDVKFYTDRPCLKYIMSAAKILDDWLATRS